MLGNRDAIANLAVRDLAAARRFYEGTLGLTVAREMGEEVLVFKSGKTLLNVYRSKYAGTNQATAVTWNVGDDMDAVVQALKDKGVTFERYDIPGMKVEGECYSADGFKTAWFKDPDGNILHLVSG